MNDFIERRSEGDIKNWQQAKSIAWAIWQVWTMILIQEKPTYFSYIKSIIVAENFAASASLLFFVQVGTPKN